MKTAVWNQRELERLYQHYCDETGIQDFQPPVIAIWAKKRGYEMPTPPTDVEMLSRLLSHAALAARRKDSKTSILYRATLAYQKLVDGKLRTWWFDADGPTATFDKVMESYRRRKEKALNILVSAAASVDHWFSSHPTQGRPEQFDLGISDAEIRWRLLGPRGGEDDVEKVG
jgi:hypothetical protein